MPLIAGTVALIVIAAGAWYFLVAHRPAPAVATNPPLAHLSIVALPFTNLSGDPAQDYFADGVTENLTTELSRIRDSFVIARNTAFTYKGKSLDAKEIGKELGVRYVLEGSVQRDQNRVRVNAQLIDADSGAHLWADRFEEDVADLFKLQDEVVARLANSLGIALTIGEAEKGARSANPDAVDLSLHGWTLILARNSATQKDKRESVNDGASLVRPGARDRPQQPDALAGNAISYLLGNTLYGWGDPSTDYEAKVLGQASRAIDLAPDNVRAYYVKAVYSAITRRPDEALGVANAGLAINPNYSQLYLARAIAENCLGRLEPAKTDIQLALRLSPHDPFGGDLPRRLGNVRIGPWPFRRGHRPSAPGDRLGLSGVLVDLRTIGRRLHPDRQDGRGESRARRSPRSQSQTHGQMDD